MCNWFLLLTSKGGNELIHAQSDEGCDYDALIKVTINLGRTRDLLLVRQPSLSRLIHQRHPGIVWSICNGYVQDLGKTLCAGFCHHSIMAGAQH